MLQIKDWNINMSTGVAQVVLDDDNDTSFTMEKEEIKDLFWKLANDNMLTHIPTPADAAPLKLKKYTVDASDVTWFMLDYMACFDVASFT